MKLQPSRLKERVEQAGVNPEQLAAAVERDSLKGASALRAVNNWMAGRDHPRCRTTDVAKLAQALGAEVKDIAKFTSEVRHHRGSPRKAKLLVDLVRGRPALEALNILAFNPKRAAVNVRKAIDAAVTDAQNNNADVDLLVVCESRCDGGPVMKRFQPKDRGRAHQILKRFSHITISVEERPAKRVASGRRK